MNKQLQLTVEELYQVTDLSQLDFETTAELEDLSGAVGQARAVEALQFGIGMQQQGYNIFALGPTGTGKYSFIQQYFKQQAAASPTPPDWCYLNNFEQPHRPQAIKLPAGKGKEFREDMKQLCDNFYASLSAAFESEEYQTRRQTIIEEFQERQATAFKALQEEAEPAGVAIVRTPSGLAVAPVREEEVLGPEEINALSEEEQTALQKAIAKVQDKLQKILQQIPGWQRELHEQGAQLNQETADFAVGGLLGELAEKYVEFPKIIAHLQAIHEDVVEHTDFFLPANGDHEASGPSMEGEPRTPLQNYQVNLLIDHSASQGAPIIYEDNPTYQNLVGRVEHEAQLGTLLTDFRLIKPGALHRANGGYLIIDARKLLTQPYAWDGLKRALQSRQINIESLGQKLSLISTISLEPEPIPLQVKVALFGERELYYLLWELDPEFAELFKVEADFEEQMERNHENQPLYARLLATLARKEGLRSLQRAAVARVIEESARLAGDQERLSTQMRTIIDLLHEADYWAGQQAREVITVADIQQARHAQVHRANRIQERIREETLRGTYLIATSGQAIGQLNGLSVMQLGNYAFGTPSRITATVHLGEGKVLDIEREVELGGPLHTKGVLILTGYLGRRYAQDAPLAFTASLVFEQSYHEIDGDSASSAELYALLSAIGGIPLNQALAVTGSVNQQGQVQAIGGVNEKVEGFFDLCQARGLTGEQGVLIPAANVKHLMLRQDVVTAVATGKFRLYRINTIDEGIAILSGLPAGEPDATGSYPEGSVNYRVQQALITLAEKREEFGNRGEGKVADE